MAFKDLFRSAFPFISAASSLGGPVGIMAANVVGSALGVSVKPEGITDAIAVATSKDPDAMLKLKQAEDSFQLQMSQLGFDSMEKLQQLAVEDRDSARKRQIAVRDWMPAALSIGALGLFGSVLYWMFKHDLPGSTKDVLMISLGGLLTMVKDVYGFYFGSSVEASPSK